MSNFDPGRERDFPAGARACANAVARPMREWPVARVTNPFARAGSDNGRELVGRSENRRPISS